MLPTEAITTRDVLKGETFMEVLKNSWNAGAEKYTNLMEKASCW